MRIQAKGNGALLVMIDSKGAYWDRFILDQTIFSALDHLGMPWRVLDLALERPDAVNLCNCSCLLIAQNRLGSSLTNEENKVISDSVKEGMGLVNFDNDIRTYDGSYLEIFGFENINPHLYASNVMRIKDNDHYITGLQTEGEWHEFDRMVTCAAPGKWRRDIKVLAECILGREQLVYIRHLEPWSAFEPRNWPVVFAGSWGSGRAVQFTINPRVWKKGFMGRTRGIDDLFWHSIVWAARKPFIANIIPPFVTLSFDDCEGRHDFLYAEIAASYGYIPLPALFLKNVPEHLYPRIRQGIASGTIEYTTHAFDYYNHLYHKYGIGEFSDEELRDNFEYTDNWWKKAGAVPAATVRPHLGEFGVRSLPFLKARNRIYINPPLQMGLLKAEMYMDDGYYPYNMQTCYYDYLPDDKDFFVYNSMMPRFQEDFLTGCTVNLRESDHNDTDKAAASLHKNLLHGLRGGFYAEAVTHEQKFESLSMSKWDTILKKTKSKLEGIEIIMKGHDQIGPYLKAKKASYIQEISIHDDTYELSLKGAPGSSQLISVFRDADDSVNREFVATEAES